MRRREVIDPCEIDNLSLVPQCHFLGVIGRPRIHNNNFVDQVERTSQAVTEVGFLVFDDHAQRNGQGQESLPFALQDAQAEFEVNTMAGAAGLDLPSEPPLLHFSRLLEVLIWWPQRVS